ncbi:MAG: DEAD/DEAH box helicase family protein [Myxococcales bacterium]
MRFDRGTLVIEGLPPGFPEDGLPGAIWDPRSRCLRAPAYRLGAIERALTARGVSVSGSGAAWTAPAGRFSEVALRPYQRAALDAWTLSERRGVVVLPTGAGKTRVASGAIAEMAAATLCIVPTRTLLHQWVSALEKIYSGGVGVLGDGVRTLRPITVTTVESAYRYMPRIGHRFALLVVDEAHHFGGGIRDEALEMAVASHRLGLTATPLPAGQAACEVQRLIGPEVYRLDVGDLLGTYLADLQIVTLELALDAAERTAYERAQGTFRDAFRAFARAHPDADFQSFSRAAGRSEVGRRVLAAFHEARRIAQYSRAKSQMVGRLLSRHREGRTLVFTADNRAAYAIAREHLVMPITCDIGRAERERAFELFREGKLRALVSSQVLNEGVDVPEAEVAIVVGAKQGEREYVQRIGRVLRKPGGRDKRATVYELVSAGTTEVRRTARKRQSLVA